MQYLTYFTFIFTLLASCLQAQIELPRSNVYLFNLEQVNNEKILFKHPRFLTAFNQKGYNNQPVFFGPNEIYLTVAPPNAQQTDIYKLDLRTKSKARITKTAESEFSPKPMFDNNLFSVVRVETDANQTQRVWELPIDRSHGGKPIMKYLVNVGYHHWLNTYELALFMVSNPNYMMLADSRTDKTTQLVSRIGRCFQTLPNGNLAYINKITEQTWYIKELDLTTKSSSIISETLAGSEDFIILKDGTFLMGKGSKLYKLHPAFDEVWKEVADFRAYNINKITRLALSADNKLAIVSE